MEDKRASDVWLENERWVSGDPSKNCGCPINIHSTTYPIQCSDHDFATLLMVLTVLMVRGYQTPKCKADCFFFSGGKDFMEKTIPVCFYHNKVLLDCLCEYCEKYISQEEVYKMAKESVEKKGMLYEHKGHVL